METTKDTKSTKNEEAFEPLSRDVIGCAIEVHKHLGPGLLESAYEQCLAHELRMAGVPFQLQASIPVHYKGFNLDCGYRIDVLVDNRLIVELKSVDKVTAIHEAQLITYMKLAEIRTGLLLNFNSRVMKDGVKRYVL